LKWLFFLDIIGRYETFSKHGFQVSGVRPAVVFSLLTPDTRNLSANVQFSCNPTTFRVSQPFSQAEWRGLDLEFFTEM
ncbi:MAG: hypothetical protein PVG81_14105, partial [Desulfobacterales bacterium]